MQKFMEDKGADDKNTEGKHKRVSVGFEEKNFGENIKKEDVEKENRKIMRSMTDLERREQERDKISKFWMKVKNMEGFYDITVYTSYRS